MQPAGKGNFENEPGIEITPGFDAATTAIFNSAFDVFGTLDRGGRVVTLSGKIFDKTNTNAELLRGQQFS
jgi:hypothetical protein